MASEGGGLISPAWILLGMRGLVRWYGFWFGWFVTGERWAQDQ